jgi:hypothetical protein
MGLCLATSHCPASATPRTGLWASVYAARPPQPDARGLWAHGRACVEMCPFFLARFDFDTEFEFQCDLEQCASRRCRTHLVLGRGREIGVASQLLPITTMCRLHTLADVVWCAFESCLMDGWPPLYTTVCGCLVCVSRATALHSHLCLSAHSLIPSRTHLPSPPTP